MTTITFLRETATSLETQLTSLLLNNTNTQESMKEAFAAFREKLTLAHKSNIEGTTRFEEEILKLLELEKKDLLLTQGKEQNDVP